MVRFHLSKSSFWSQIHQFGWWMDRWCWQSNFKFAKSSHTASRTGRVVNSIRTAERRLYVCFLLLWYFASGYVEGGRGKRCVGADARAAKAWLQGCARLITPATPPAPTRRATTLWSRKKVYECLFKSQFWNLLFI